METVLTTENRIAVRGEGGGKLERGKKSQRWQVGKIGKKIISAFLSSGAETV